MAVLRRVLGLAALLAISACIRRLPAGRSYTAHSPVQHIGIRIEQGSVRVVGTQTDRVLAIHQTPAHASNVRSRVNVYDGRMYIDLSCDRPLDCRGDVELRVPPDVSLDITVLYGDVAVQDTTGKLSTQILEGGFRGIGLRSDDVYLYTY